MAKKKEFNELTEQAIKDYVGTCPQVEKAEMEEEEASYKSHKAEILWEIAKSERDLLKGLLFCSSRID